MSAPLLVLLALQAPLDEGTLLVRQDTAEIGREAFRLSAAPGGVGGAGWTLASTVRYDRTRPIVVLNPILQVGPDSAPASLNRDAASLHHVSVTGGANQLVHLWLDRAGRLLKLEIPSRHLTAERTPAS